MSVSGFNPFSQGGGNLFSDQNASANDRSLFTDLWNNPSNSAKDVLSLRSETKDSLAQNVADFIGGENWSAATQRNLLFSLDHDPNTQSNFGQAESDALAFAGSYKDPNNPNHPLEATSSDQTAMEEIAIQLGLQHQAGGG